MIGRSAPDDHHQLATRLVTRAAIRERNEPDVPGALDRGSQRTLVLCAGTQLAAGFDFASLADMPAQPPKVLVIDVSDVINAKLADLATRRESTAASARSSATWSPAGAWTAAIAPAIPTATFASVALLTALAAFTLGAAEAGALRSFTAFFV